MSAELETKKVDLKLPKNVWNALDYYLPLTGFWGDEASANEALSAYVSHMVQQYLRSEPSSGIPDATEKITATLEELLES